MRGSFDGKVAVVTGAPSGIGRALSEELVEAATAARRAAGGSAAAAVLDVSDFERVRGLVERVAAEHGRLERLSPGLVLLPARRLVATTRKELAGAGDAPQARR